MAKKQTRRSVSIRGTTYTQIRAYCENHNISMSEFVEQRIAQFFEGQPQAGNGMTKTPVPIATSPVVAKGSTLDSEELQDAARTFRF